MKTSACLLGTALLLLPAAAFADSLQEFLHKALQGDNSEIMLGRLAAGRANNPGVRDYGRTLQTDHTQARNDVLNVAKRFGVRSDRDMAPEARDERDKLSNL